MPIIDAESQPAYSRLPSAQPVRMNQTANSKMKTNFIFYLVLSW